MKTLPYGSWPSPISAELVSSDFVSFGDLKQDGSNLYFLETRPNEGGRTALMKMRDDGNAVELTNQSFNVRTMVHEYGGGSYAVLDGRAFFVNRSDQDIYCVDEQTGDVARITSTGKNERYADLVAVSCCLFCVRETHYEDREAKNDLVCINVSDGSIDVIHEGHDFYAAPTPSPDHNRFAFVAWDHPNMPWDGTQLYLATLTLDCPCVLTDLTVIAGGPEESIEQPRWIDSERLAFVSDQTGYWNLYVYDSEGAVCIASESAEYGVPAWQFGSRTFAVMSDTILVSLRITENGPELVYVDCDTGLVSPCTDRCSSYASVTQFEGDVVFIGGHTDNLSSIVRFSPIDGSAKILRTQGELPVTSGYISEAQAVKYNNIHGQEVFANFYAPKNLETSGSDSERPPLVVISHGGPTGHSNASFSFWVQYFTTRGWAVLDVNYGGSTGYGREYRSRLQGEWGNIDVEDCVAGVRYLISQDLVDSSRVAIRGGSAGGYTTLRALTVTDTFKAGASYYGVADVRALVNDTHKFESRYIDGLIPEAEIDARSPIHSIDKLSSPTVFYQGTEDAIVPPNQSRMMFDSLAKKGITTALFLFEKESHGFVRSENIKTSLETEFVFFCQVFGIEPDGLSTNSFKQAEVANASWY